MNAASRSSPGRLDAQNVRIRMMLHPRMDNVMRILFRLKMSAAAGVYTIL